MAQRVEQSQPHAPPAVELHTGDVGNGCNVVIVETVMKSKDRGREESKVKAVRREGHESCGPPRSSSLFHKLPGIGNASCTPSVARRWRLSTASEPDPPPSSPSTFTVTVASK